MAKSVCVSVCVSVCLFPTTEMVHTTWDYMAHDKPHINKDLQQLIFMHQRQKNSALFTLKYTLDGS